MSVPADLVHRFDYYRATVPAHYQIVLEVLIDGLTNAGIQVELRDGRPRWTFRHNVHLVGPNDVVLVEILHGGDNPWPCIEAEGSISPLVADLLRAAGPHRPSRVDPSCDMEAPGLFLAVRQILFDVSAQFGLKRPRDVSNNDPDQGDTCTLGSRKSPFYLRVYQPGLKRAQEEGRVGDQITQAERNTVRVELEFKPSTLTAKEAAATLSASDMWALSPWVAEVARRVFAMDVKPISIAERRESNTQRALRFAAMQYNRAFRELWDQCGRDPEAFGEAWAERCGFLDVEASHVA